MPLWTAALTGSGKSRARAKIPGHQVQSLSNGVISKACHSPATDFKKPRRSYCTLLLSATLVVVILSLSIHARRMRNRLYSDESETVDDDDLADGQDLYVNRTDTTLTNNQTRLLGTFEADENEEEIVLNLDPVNRCALKPPNWPASPTKPSGYLLVRCNGGLNQMRAAICDMVAIARHLNATMVIPELDKASFWADSSDFGDVFDVNHFIDTLEGEVKVIRQLPPKHRLIQSNKIYTIDPVSWSDVGYYTKVVFPLLRKHKVLRLNRTDSRLANNPPDVPKPLQRLRCRVQYHALQFTGPIRVLGQRIINRLKSKGPVIALHLRYEMDMLAFTGCTHGCTPQEAKKLTKLRYRTAQWKEKRIIGSVRRREGACPLTPEEVALLLRAMGYGKGTQIYVASGKIYGGKRRMAKLLKIFPNTVRKEMLATAEELAPFRNHSSQLAALDYMVSVASDVFLSTFHGNMARLVEGHRRYLGHRKTIIPDRKALVQLFNAYENGTFSWEDLSREVQAAHATRIGAPQERLMLAGQPKQEDNFFQNPHECICKEDKERAAADIQAREKGVILSEPHGPKQPPTRLIGSVLLDHQQADRGAAGQTNSFI
eukprot:SM000034S12765  [mRNA]  locus=s34:632947:636695:+ [translate_table: standard]